TAVEPLPRDSTLIVRPRSALGLPSAVLPGQDTTQPQQSGGAAPAAAGDDERQQQEGLLDYLLGGGA
ncbi:MAG: hypothetical protein M3389_17640, partial [Actinomycetota bacterium]|nr:hypothetical protein [Actinomycetota bacterium]